MIALEMVNRRLDCASPFQHLPGGPGRHFRNPSREMNQAKSRILVTTVLLVHNDVFWFHTRKGN